MNPVTVRILLWVPRRVRRARHRLELELAIARRVYERERSR